MLEILATPEFGQFIANVLLALVAVLVPLIGNAVRNFINANKGSKEFELLSDVARMAVLAAEQAGLSGVIEDKKEAALSYASEILRQKGLNIDIVALDAAIEAAVADELNRPALNEAAYQKANAA